MLSNRSYVVTWTSQNQDGSGYGVYAQRFTIFDVPASIGGLVFSDPNDNGIRDPGEGSPAQPASVTLIDQWGMTADPQHHLRAVSLLQSSPGRVVYAVVRCSAEPCAEPARSGGRRHARQRCRRAQQARRTGDAGPRPSCAQCRCRLCSAGEHLGDVLPRLQRRRRSSGRRTGALCAHGVHRRRCYDHFGRGQLHNFRPAPRGQDRRVCAGRQFRIDHASLSASEVTGGGPESHGSGHRRPRDWPERREQRGPARRGGRTNRRAICESRAPCPRRVRDCVSTGKRRLFPSLRCRRRAHRYAHAGSYLRQRRPEQPPNRLRLQRAIGYRMAATGLRIQSKRMVR